MIIKLQVQKRIVAHPGSNEITLDEIGEIMTIFKLKLVSMQHIMGVGEDETLVMQLQ
jgi:hypothetical protein